jgi:hypothetical protein
MNAECEFDRATAETLPRNIRPVEAERRCPRPAEVIADLPGLAEDRRELGPTGYRLCRYHLKAYEDLRNAPPVVAWIGYASRPSHWDVRPLGNVPDAPRKPRGNRPE